MNEVCVFGFIGCGLSGFDLMIKRMWKWIGDFNGSVWLDVCDGGGVVRDIFRV